VVKSKEKGVEAPRLAKLGKFKAVQCSEPSVTAEP
jgi:hypothetical protein